MTPTIPQSASASHTTARRYGPAVGEPPVWVDPRRWGSLIGLIGGMVFIASYSAGLNSTVLVTVQIVGVGLVGSALFAHYIRPVALGPLTRPRAAALATYGACVVGELVLISVGSRALGATGDSDLRPALIAAVVGVHFLPFAWAFGERMFYWLGGLVATLGVLGLLAGFLGVANAADTMAVIAGLTMLVVITSYAQGRFAPRAPTTL